MRRFCTIVILIQSIAWLQAMQKNCIADILIDYRNQFEKTIFPQYVENVMTGQYELALIVLASYPALVNRRIGPKKQTVLMYAVDGHWPFEAYLKLIQIPGIDIDLQDDDGFTALMLATLVNAKSWGSTLSASKIKMLSSCKAKASLASPEGYTALHIVVEGKLDSDTYRLMSEDCRQKFKKNVKLVIEYLVAAGADIDAQDFWKFTPLMRATQMGFFDMVEELLSHGANPQAIEWQAWSALDFSAEYPKMQEVINQKMNKSPDSQDAVCCGSLCLEIFEEDQRISAMMKVLEEDCKESQH